MPGGTCRVERLRIGDGMQTLDAGPVLTGGGSLPIYSASGVLWTTRDLRVPGQHLTFLPFHHLLIAGSVAAESLHPGRQALAALSPRVLADLRATVTAPDLSSLGRQPSARQLRKPHKARVLLALLPKVPLFVQSVRRKIFFVVCRAI